MFLEVDGDPESYEVDLLPGVTPRLRYQVMDTAAGLVPIAAMHDDVLRFESAWQQFVAKPEVTLQKVVIAGSPFFWVAVLDLAGAPFIKRVERRAGPADAWRDTFGQGFVRSASPRMSLDAFNRLRFRVEHIRQIPALLHKLFSAGQISGDGGSHAAGTYRVFSRGIYDLEKVPRAVCKTITNYMIDRMGREYAMCPEFRPILDYCLGDTDPKTHGPFFGFAQKKIGMPAIDELPTDRHALYLCSAGKRVVGLLKLYGSVTYNVHLGSAPSSDTYEHITWIDYNGVGRVPAFR